jgi:Domain of unknown function (DUF5666)
MNQSLIDALDDCIKSLRAGIPIDRCLERYPDETPELGNLLKTVAVVMELSVENIPADALARSRTKLIDQSKVLSKSENDAKASPFGLQLAQLLERIAESIHGLRPHARRVVLASVIALLLIVISGGFLITSAKSLPGEPLYPVKIAVEDIGIYFVPGGTARNNVEGSYNQQRVSEVTKLIALGRLQQVSFEGVLQSIEDNTWMVSGIPVKIRSDTTILDSIEGSQPIEPGVKLEVEGVTDQSGWVSANEIHLREYKFIGLVDKISSHIWQISGNQIIITPKTQIDTGILVGDDVTVLLSSQDSGLYALAILHEVHPVATAVPTQTDEVESSDSDHQVNNETEHDLEGTLEKIGANYWVVNDQIVFIVGDTHLPDDVRVGDIINVTYTIETNGSFTATDIEKTGNTEDSEQQDERETPEPSEVDGSAESNIEHPEEVHAQETETAHHEDASTPVPTEEH